MTDWFEVLTFLDEAQGRGQPCVLVLVCAVEGSSMREPGTIMGVAADGSFAGSLSGGCIENAVVAEALDTLAANAPRMVRFGAGSPYLDIRLPCGGGLDLHFEPLNDTPMVGQCLSAIAARQPLSLVLELGRVAFTACWQPTQFDTKNHSGAFGHWPGPRLAIIGHGAGVEALAMQAVTLGCATDVLTPDDRIVAALGGHSVSARLIERRSQTDLLTSDPWTAFAFLFHDHDWEIELIARALDLPHFYLGAMGGRKAHAMRSAALRTRSVSEAQIATIHAPIGLFHSSRDPRTLALSTLAQVIRAYQDSDFRECDFEAVFG